MLRCDMLKIWKNSYRPSIYIIGWPVGFLTSGSGIEKGRKFFSNKYQYTKKFVFQYHTVTHGIDFRKSPPLGQKIYGIQNNVGFNCQLFRVKFSHSYNFLIVVLGLFWIGEKMEIHDPPLWPNLGKNWN